VDVSAIDLDRALMPARVSDRVLGHFSKMLARDLARPVAYRAAADIAGRLGELDAWPTAPWPSASPAAAEFVLAQHHQAKALTDALAERG